MSNQDKLLTFFLAIIIGFTSVFTLNNHVNGQTSRQIINPNFTGIWKAKVSRCNPIQTNPLVLGECVICPQIQILCPPGFTLVPQSCTECAHCEKCKGFREITLNLCVIDGVITGTVNESGVFNAEITSQTIISSDEVIVGLSGRIETLRLKLLNNRTLQGSLDAGFTLQTFIATKVSPFGNCRKPPPVCCNGFIIRQNDRCPIGFFPSFCSPNSRNPVKVCCPTSTSSSSSSGNCTPVGSCRGPDGTILPCPEGTVCSAQPVYQCYPNGCPYPICLSPDTRIKTNTIQKRVADIKEGDLVLTDNEKPVKVLKTNKVEVKNHKILKVTLNDATVLEVSPGHPTADGRLFKDLKWGDSLDKRLVVEIKQILYNYKYTYDILPDSSTGNYYANGVLIGSTLKKH